jgi:hypothetical protein
MPSMNRRQIRLGIAIHIPGIQRTNHTGALGRAEIIKRQASAVPPAGLRRPLASDLPQPPADRIAIHRFAVRKTGQKKEDR